MKLWRLADCKDEEGRGTSPFLAVPMGDLFTDDKGNYWQRTDSSVGSHWTMLSKSATKHYLGQMEQMEELDQADVEYLRESLGLSEDVDL